MSAKAIRVFARGIYHKICIYKNLFESFKRNKISLRKYLKLNMNWHDETFENMVKCLKTINLLILCSLHNMTGDAEFPNFNLSPGLLLSTTILENIFQTT